MSEILVDIRKEGLYDVFRKDTVTVNELINAIKDLKCELDRLEESQIDCERDPFDRKMDYMLENDLI